MQMKCLTNAVASFFIGGTFVMFGTIFLIFGAVSWGLMDASSIGLAPESDTSKASTELMKIVGVTTTVVGTLMLLLGLSLCSITPFLFQRKCPCYFCNQQSQASQSQYIDASISQSQFVLNNQHNIPEFSIKVNTSGDNPRKAVYRTTTAAAVGHLRSFGTDQSLIYREANNKLFVVSSYGLDAVPLSRYPCKYYHQKISETSDCHSVTEINEPIPTEQDVGVPNGARFKISVDRQMSSGGGDTIFSQTNSSPASTSEHIWDQLSPQQMECDLSQNSEN